jgi:TRAP-type mannitol/chloroaromatic compound transport system substrate-binding protein
MMELIVNREAFEKLPNDLKNIITVASGAVNTLMLSAFDQKNMEYYLKMKKEGRVEFREFSEPVLNKLKAYTDEVMEEITGKDSMSKKAYESFNSFKMNMYDWFKISERNYR